MIHNHWLIILCVVLLMGVQLNFFFNSIFGKSTQKRQRYFYFIMFGILDYLYLTIKFFPIVSSILFFVLVFSIAQSYQTELKLNLVFTMLLAVLFTIVDFISVYILFALNSVDFSGPRPIAGQDQLAHIKVVFLDCILMFPVIQILRLVAKRRRFSLPYRYYALFLVIPIVSVYQLNIASHKSFYYFLSSVALLFLNIMIVYFFDTIMEKFQYRHENERLQQQMDYQDANYEKVVHSFKSIKRIIHDTNQQFLYIEQCIKRNELASAVEHIRTTLNKIEGSYQKVNTGNLVIDALVTNTLDIGQANGIRIDTKLSLSSHDVPIDRYDLCVVIGNMLDNAIEASKQVKVAADRHIVIKIHATESNLLIHIRNYTDHEVIRLRSQKPNREYHGIGLTNIARICDKYGGHMTVETENKQFHNMVLLPLMANNP
ncbi:GHKL domain-containing protein [Paenibacillus pasadenensis]|uniref:sensor histidine kinase n=1 Tax=Paenibacillus pasadenensis TaxID=217090 RepID=UPI0020408B9E|nr:sensor histidine kinase [Paenibacillus pasadenensis]MCM3746974.1 GHKL domain-containing protein [Paenibacillus pasadenensis]